MSTKGLKFSEVTKIKMRNAHKGEKAYNWKAEKASYGALHMWLKTWRGSPKNCEICKRTDCKKYEWANKDHKYRRNLDDWIRLCTSCHRNYDIRNNNYYAKKIKSQGNYSIYNGVSWSKNDKKWVAYITFKKQRMHIGYFEKEHYAAMARDIWVKELFGNILPLNFEQCGKE
jgi:hypothetical protein